jgi:hypothetical protein
MFARPFAPAIVGEILTINAAAFGALLVLNRLGAIAGLGVKPEMRLLGNSYSAPRT